MATLQGNYMEILLYRRGILPPNLFSKKFKSQEKLGVCHLLHTSLCLFLNDWLDVILIY